MIVAGIDTKVVHDIDSQTLLYKQFSIQSNALTSHYSAEAQQNDDVELKLLNDNRIVTVDETRQN